MIHEPFNERMFTRQKNLNCELLNASLELLESATKHTYQASLQQFKWSQNDKCFFLFLFPNWPAQQQGSHQVPNIDIYIFYMDINIAAHFYRHINIADINDSSTVYRPKSEATRRKKPQSKDIFSGNVASSSRPARLPVTAQYSCGVAEVSKR